MKTKPQQGKLYSKSDNRRRVKDLIIDDLRCTHQQCKIREPPSKKGGGEIVIKSNNYELDIHWSIGIDANGIKGEITPQQQLSDRA